MTGPKIGALFAGYGGLDLAVQQVYGGHMAWYSEVDKGALKILAHRFPDAPNVGDVTTADWSQVEPVDILTGGSPCQDLSHAGRRAGMTEGTRSNLWVAMREAIAQLRPGLVVWENVRGALSAEAASAVEPCAGCVGDRPGVSLRALGRVVGDLSELGYVGRWHGLRAADVGAPHGRWRVFLTAYPASDAGRLAHGDGGVAAYADGGVNLASGARSDQRAVPHGDGRGAAAALLPTPSCSDTNGAGVHGNGGVDLRTAVAQLFPTPTTRDHKDHTIRREPHRPDDVDTLARALTDVPCALVTTPTSADAKASGSAGYNGNEFCTLTDAAVRGKGGMPIPLLPTPSAQLAHGSQTHRSGSRTDELLLDGIAAQDRWGDYAAAITRWEHALGRPAPAPTMTSTKGNPQLSPAFVEWLMGLPAGWVTDVPGITRNEALKALGNGVVPQQAAAALMVATQAVVS